MDAREDSHRREAVSGNGKETVRLGDGLRTSETRRRPRKPFVRALGHELRGPLNAIVGFSDILLEGLAGKLNQEQRDYLERVRSAGQRLADMHGNAIEILKIQTKAAGAEVEEFNLSDMVTDMSLGWEEDCRAKRLLAEAMVADGLIVETDRLQLARCLTILLTNAVEFTEEGCVSLSAYESGEMVRVAVNDTGKGIAEADLPFVFEPFARIEAMSESKPRGTELSLFLVKTIVTSLLKGSVSVRSKLGEGTEFVIEFPKRLRAAS